MILAGELCNAFEKLIDKLELFNKFKHIWYCTNIYHEVTFFFNTRLPDSVIPRKYHTEL